MPAPALAQPAAHLVGVDAALARQPGHRGTRLHAQRNQLRLGLLVVQAAAIGLATHHQPTPEILQIVFHRYVPTLIYVGT